MLLFINSWLCRDGVGPFCQWNLRVWLKHFRRPFWQKLFLLAAAVMGVCKFRACLRCGLLFERVWKLLLTRLSLFENFCDSGCLWSRTFRKPTPIEVPLKLLLFSAYVPWWLKWFNQYMEVFASFCFQSTVFSSLRLWFSVDMVVGIRLASRFERFVLVWKIWRVQILVAYSVVGSLRTNFGNSDFTWRKVDGGVWYSRISILDLVWNFRCRNWHVR